MPDPPASSCVHRPTALAIAALGALLFVVGLAAGPWLFLARLAPDPAAAPMTTGVGFRNVLLFTAFALHHSIMARSRAKRWLMARIPPCLERSIYVWVASLLFLAVCLAWEPTRDETWRAPGPLGLGLALVQVSGLLVTALGARVLDVWDLAGVRQVLVATATGTTSAGDGDPILGSIGPSAPARTSQSPRAESEPLDAITTRGPFGIVRHPIYLGWLLLVWPSPVMTSGRLLFAAVSTFYLVVAIPLEERSLIGHFGDKYRHYQAQVRWRLIPGVW